LTPEELGFEAQLKRRSDRSLILRHTQHNDRPLHDDANEVLKHVARLWGFAVQMESANSAGEVTKWWRVEAPPSRDDEDEV
jgi:stage V sporulation protein R